jgi:hypothetical protein
MAGTQSHWKHTYDFIGSGAAFPTSADPATPWLVTDTSSAGAPTYTHGVDNGESTGDYAVGEAVLTLAVTTEVENVCLSFGDVLQYDINKIKGFEWRIRQGQATIDAATSISFGMTGDRDDAIDSIAAAMLFRLIGANDVVVESDDTVNNNDDVATGQVLANSYRIFKVDLAAGLTDVRFFMSDARGSMKRVAGSTRFDMSNYTAALQPFLQIQKTSDSNVDAVRSDYFEIWGIR